MQPLNQNHAMKTPTARRPMHQLLHRTLAVIVLSLATDCSTTAGTALKLYYSGINGTAVSDLTSAPVFPSSPNSPGTESLVNGLRISLNFDDLYGSWTRGFIEAPQTGNYNFWIASDDDSEFWLSPTDNPAGLVKIAENVGWVEVQSYKVKPAQKSALIPLEKGRKYYFEMRHKEGVGGDHCSVAWTLPDATFVGPIPSQHLWPYPVNLGDPSFPAITTLPLILTDFNGIPVTTLPATITVEENQPVEMTVTIEATQPAYVQWYSNSVPIANANLSTYSIPAASLTQNGATYSVTVTNSLGSASAATTLSVTADVTPPTLVDALNLGNAAGTIAVVFSEPVDPVSGTNALNYTLDLGATVSSARLGSTPDTVLLSTTVLSVGPAYTLTVSQVKDRASTPNMIAAGSTIAVEQALHTWLRLDANTGTTATDSSGNSRNGSLVNGAAPGHLGQVLRSVKFDAVNDHVRLPDGYDDFSAGMTVALWARPDSVGNWARFVDLGNSAASDNILFARNGGSDAVTFEVYQAGVTGGQVTAPGAIVQSQWQHFTATMDGSGTTTIYRNGVPLVTNTTAAPNVVTRTNNFLGRSNWGGDGYYGGRLDDVRIYNRVLMPAAIKALAAGAGADDGDPLLPTVTVVATTPTTALQSAPPGVFTVSRTGSTAATLTVQYSMGGTATNGAAYTTLSGSVIIPIGASSVNVFVQPIPFAFGELQQTAILNLSSSVAYNVGDPDAATVTIVNNSVSPKPLLATARGNSVEVWFAASVTVPSATTLGNYVFNPALTVTNATLDSRSLRVVLSLASTVPANTLLTVTGVQDPGGNSVSNQLAVQRFLTNAVNLVATVYHSPDSRGACFALATDGNALDAGGANGFDTWNTGGTDFAGLIYGTSVEMTAVKVDLGNQFGDGGSWAVPPKLYRLKTPVDTNSDRPEEEASHWEAVPAPIISGSKFDSAGDGNPSPNTPIVFDLSGLSSPQRTGYGWAVGGVSADNSSTFISIAELSAFGVPGANAAIQLVATPANFNVQSGQRAKLKVWTTYPATYQWLVNGGDIGNGKSYHGLPAVTPADNASTYAAVLTYGGNPLTNLTATLTVTPRTTAPVVRDATLDPSNSVIHVWFDESVEIGTAQTLGNYSLNDPGLTLNGASLDTEGFRVVLNYSGTPGVANPTLTVSAVQDLSGNILGSQVVPLVGLVSPATRVVANAYQQGRPNAFTRSTDGIIVNDPANPLTWTTFGSPANSTDFVGLGYAEAQVFSAVVMNLGWQFGDGGDWSEPPRVFLQKTTADTNQNPPEDDPANWIEVPAVPMSGNIFDREIAVPANTTPLPNNVIAFDLSALPLAQRSGYGWAIGGVRGNALPGQARFVTVSELRGFGQAASTFTVAGAPQFVLDLQPSSITKLAGAPLTLSTLVAGTQPLHYQWQRNGVNLSNSGRITGANSNVLSVVELLPGDAGTYQLLVTNSAGSAASVLATVAITPGPATFNGGTNWTRSGGATMSGNLLQLTTGFDQGMSAFLNDRFYIGAFRATFTYQVVGANGNNADGTTFVLQNSAAGPSALGGRGGDLGYRPTVTPSAALVMNIYPGATVGYSFETNGILHPPYLSTAPVNLSSGNPIDVTVNYDGTTLFVTMTDTVTTSSFGTSTVLDLPLAVGSEQAYVGFTSGSGGLAANQQVTDFVFTSLPAIAIEATGPNTLVFTWPIAVGNFVLQENTVLNGPGWANVPATLDVVSGLNQVIVTPQAGNRFYRLQLQ